MLRFTGRIAAHRPEGLNSGASIGSVSSRHRTPGATPHKAKASTTQTRPARLPPPRLSHAAQGSYAIVTTWGQPFRPCTAKEPLDTSVEAREPHPVGPPTPLAIAWRGRPRPTLQLLIFEASPQRKGPHTESQDNFTLPNREKHVANTLPQVLVVGRSPSLRRMRCSISLTSSQELRAKPRRRPCQGRPACSDSRAGSLRIAPRGSTLVPALDR
jgi:hypothetical protein